VSTRQIQARCVELSAARDAAPAEATAKTLADELHRLIDEVQNVRELGPADAGE
jgi:hypothetical protein